MKKITFLFICLLTINVSFAQGTDVLSSEQFCSGTSQLTFNNVYGGTNLTQVGCLGSIPNAAYFYLEIDQPGDLIFTLSQEDTGGNPIDVDFIAWGPFINIGDADTSISFTDCPTCPNNTTDPTFYPYAPDEIADCSFSSGPSETMNILNAMQGEIYVVLITNYNGTQGTIDFQQTGGTGTTTCASSPVCGSQYYDIGGTTGPYSGNETTTINPYFAGGTVTVNFTTLNIPDAGDVLTVYNGPNNTFPVLGTVTTTGSFTSNTTANPTGAITFELVTDGDATVGTGWVADITCTPPLTPPTCGFTFYDSGGSGGDYSANELQTTTIFPDFAGDLLTATFTAFDTETSNDELIIYDGPDASYPLLGTFSGTTIPGPFTSSDPTGALTFVFTSNGVTQNSGWAADLTCSLSTFTCGSTFYDSGGAGGDYSNNEFTSTTLVPDIFGTAITATFTFFDLESCCDELSVYDGPDATYPLLGTFAGTALPGPFTSSDPSGALTFVFDSDSSVTYGGWAADLTCSTPTCGSTFYDSGGLGGDYTSNESQTTTIFPDFAGDLLTATFTAFDTETSNDELIIYDGPDASYPLLGTFSGTTIPGPFTSSDPTGALTFVFTSNGVTQNSGWAADLTCSLSTFTCGSTFYDSGGAGGDYSNNEFTSTTLVPDIFGTAITATFTFFDLESCCDELSVYDGPDATYPLLGTFAGTALPGPFTSSDPSGALTFVFDSDSSVTYGGWAADITCIDNCNLIITDTNYPIGADACTLDYTELTTNAASPPQVTWSPTTNLYTNSALTTPYFGGFAGTVYAAPNGIQTYTATDQNSCTDTVTVTHNKKTWNGSDVSDGANWYVGNNWTPFGVPNITSCVVIPDNSTVPNNPIADKSQVPIPLPPLPATARNLTLEANAYLEIETNSELIVQEWVNVQNTGILNLKSSSSLIQIEDSAVNAGDIHMQRSPNFDESAVADTEYVYWSSPVSNFQVTDISPSSTLLFDWTTTVAGNGTGNHGEWFSVSGTMTDGTGYIVRGLDGTPATIPATAYAISNNSALFSGVPNNGVITKPIFHGGYDSGPYAGIGNGATNEDDNWNLIGNPYPSAISANAFTNLNTNINGTVYVWPHDSTYSAVTLDPFYEDYVYNYDANDYIEHNNTGSNPPGTSDLFIGSGQAFFVMMNNSATSGTNVTFNNSMRQMLSTYNNSTFFRTDDSGDYANQNNIERHRIWLDLLSPNTITNTILVGYIQNATNNFDRLYDGYDFSSGDNSGFYSLLNNETLSIQGRSLPFMQEDIVPLGIIANETGSHTIAINTLDGLFISENQNIYIEDTELNMIHDIRLSPYTFTIDAGIHDDRFILRYTNETLGVNALDGIDGISIIAPNSAYIKVTSEIGIIDTITIYDIVGRVVFKTEAINQSEFILKQTKFSDGTYIVKVELYNEKQKIQKVVIRQ
jgi:hypothetical protein